MFDILSYNNWYLSYILSFKLKRFVSFVDFIFKQQKPKTKCFEECWMVDSYFVFVSNIVFGTIFLFYLVIRQHNSHNFMKLCNTKFNQNHKYTQPLFTHFSSCSYCTYIFITKRLIQQAKLFKISSYSFYTTNESPQNHQ